MILPTNLFFFTLVHTAPNFPLGHVCICLRSFLAAEHTFPSGVPGQSVVESMLPESRLHPTDGSWCTNPSPINLQAG